MDMWQAIAFPFDERQAPTLELDGLLARNMRTCRLGGHMLPLTDEYYGKRVGRWSNRCRFCERKLDRNHYHSDREGYGARKKAQRDANLEHIALRRRALYVKTRETVSAQAIARYRRSPTLRLRATIRTRFNKAFNGKAGRSWQAIVGYTIAELRAHIEALLVPLMTWENYGTHWVIDHKIPVASFDLPRQVRECWALSNLQPLEINENRRKGSKLLPEHIQ